MFTMITKQNFFIVSFCKQEHQFKTQLLLAIYEASFEKFENSVRHVLLNNLLF